MAFGSTANSETPDGSIGESKLSTGVTGRIGALENMLAINTLRDSVDAGWSILDMIDGIADEYEDETGVESSTAVYNASTNSYTPVTSDTLSLLVQSESSDGNTTFTDASDNAFTVTPSGNFQHSTGITAKFGSTSMKSDGTGDFLTVASDAAFTFGTGDFTFEFWVNPTDITGTMYMIDFRLSGGTQDVPALFRAGGTMNYYVAGAAAITASSDLSIGTWQHVAVCRLSGTTTMYLDGNSVGSFSDSTDYLTGAVTLADYIQGGFSFPGYFEELRVIKGVAQYTGNFTVPSAPFTVDPPQNYELISEDFTADTEATCARLVILHEQTEAVTINTDVKAYASRDGGTTWEEAVLSLDAAFNSTVDVLTSGDIDISERPSGTTMKYKVETFNNKNQAVHGTWLQWR